jgi:hypothetical protein
MFSRFGRRRFEPPSEVSSSERPETENPSNDLISLIQTIEAAAAGVYGRHGLPQRPGHYRRSADGGAWQLLEDGLTPAQKWSLVGAADGERWRYAAYEALGAHSDIPAVRQASALLAACQGLRQRLADHIVISPQDLADSIRLGEAWRRLAEDASYDHLAPLHFLPPDESAPQP